MVYEKFFYLNESPFSITPDPRFLYLSRQHQEALDLLSFGIAERKGFLMLSGEVGTGKTTLCRALLNKLNPKIRTALILNPLLSDAELISAIIGDFGLKAGGASLKEQIDILNAFLIEIAAQGGNAVVIIDEAQHLEFRTLEMVRLLSNLETEKMKLLQIVLVGQPELREKLNLPELRQLNQRVVVRYHLGALNLEETRTYIFNRLTIAGGKGSIKFTSKALKSIFEASCGVPRLINIVCDRMLTAAFAAGKRVVDSDIEGRAIEELERDGTIRTGGYIEFKRGRAVRKYAPYIGIAASVLLFIVAAAYYYLEIPIRYRSSHTGDIESEKQVYSYAPPVAESPKQKGGVRSSNVNHVQNKAAGATKKLTAAGREAGSDAAPASVIADSTAPPSLTDVKFRGLVILLDGVKHVVSDRDTLEVAKGAKIKIIDCIVDGVSSRDVTVNVLGFAGNETVNSGEDRWYLINTETDLWAKYSRDMKGKEYPIIIKHAESKIGEVFIKIRGREG